MFRALSSLIALALVLAACSGATDTTTTAAESSVSTQAASTTEAPTTVAPSPTTTAAPATTTTTTTGGAGTVDADAAVAAKTAAAEAALPEGWTVSTSAAVSDAESEAVAYESCLLPDDFDIDNLDDHTAAALETEFRGPDANPPLQPPMGALEARVFNSEEEAAAAFAVFERMWGTPEGLDCMTESVTSLMGPDFPAEGITITTEAVALAGSQAGARFEMEFAIQGFTGNVFVEFQGTRMGDCTVIASFITFGEPFDRSVAESLIAAAVDA